MIDVSGREANWAEAIQVRWDSNGERAAHIALNDPASVLALAGFVRAVADDITNKGDPELSGDDYHDGYAEGSAAASRAIALWLARIWDGHPDFAPKWNPA